MRHEKAPRKIVLLRKCGGLLTKEREAIDKEFGTYITKGSECPLGVIFPIFFDIHTLNF